MPTVLDELSVILSTKVDARDLKRFKTQIAGAKTQMEGLSAAATRIGTALTAGMAASIGAFAVFEVELAKIEGLVGINRDQVKAWGKDIEELAPAVRKRPAELARALLVLTSGGLRGADAMEALEASAKASTGGLGDMESIARTVTAAMQSYKAAGLTATEATDSLTEAVRLGNLEAPQLAGALSDVLPVASKMGVQFKEVGGLMAAMSLKGVNAPKAATQLNAVMLALLKPTEDSVKAFDEVGLSVEGLRDAAAGPGGLWGVLKTLNTAFGHNDAAMARAFPSVEALRSVFNLLGESVGDNDKLMRDMADSTGMTEAAFRPVADTTKGTFDQTLSELMVTLTQLGERLAPLAKQILEFATNMLNAFQGMPETTQKVVAGVIGMGPGLLAAVAASKGLYAVLMGGAGLGAIGLVAALGALAAALIYFNWDEIEARWKAGTDKLKGQWDEFLAYIKDESDKSLTEVLRGEPHPQAVDAFVEVHGKPDPSAGEVTKQTFGGLFDLWEWIQTPFEFEKDMFAAFKGQVSGTETSQKSVWQKFADWITTPFDFELEAAEWFKRESAEWEKALSDFGNWMGRNIRRFLGDDITNFLFGEAFGRSVDVESLIPSGAMPARPASAPGPGFLEGLIADIKSEWAGLESWWGRQWLDTDDKLRHHPPAEGDDGLLANLRTDIESAWDDVVTWWNGLWISTDGKVKDDGQPEGRGDGLLSTFRADVEGAWSAVETWWNGLWISTDGKVRHGQPQDEAEGGWLSDLWGDLRGDWGDLAAWWGRQFISTDDKVKDHPLAAGLPGPGGQSEIGGLWGRLQRGWALVETWWSGLFLTTDGKVKHGREGDEDGDFLSDLWGDIKSEWANLESWWGRQFLNTGDKVRDHPLARGVPGPMGQSDFGGLGGRLRSWWGGITTWWDGLTFDFEGIFGKPSNEEGGGNLFGWIDNEAVASGSVWAQTWDDVKSRFRTPEQGLFGWVDTLWTDMKAALNLDSLWETIKSGPDDLFAWVERAWKDLVDRLLRLIPEGLRDFLGIEVREVAPVPGLGRRGRPEDGGWFDFLDDLFARRAGGLPAFAGALPVGPVPPPAAAPSGPTIIISPGAFAEGAFRIDAPGGDPEQIAARLGDYLSEEMRALAEEVDGNALA